MQSLHPVSFASPLWLCTLAGLLAFGCTARLGGDTQEEQSDARKGTEAVAGLREDDNTKLDRSAECDVEAVTASPLRRLSHVQYARTIDSLFPEKDMPGLDLAAEQRVHGFENNARALAPSPILVEQRNGHAAEVASRVVSSRDAREGALGCEPETNQGCAEEFIRSFGHRAFRRPLTESEVTDYLGLFEEVEAEIDFDAALEVTLTAFLQAPQLIYQVELGEADPESNDLALTDHELATRLAYAAWQAPPDAELLALADAGALRDPEEYAAQVDRLLADERAAESFADFHRQWLELDEVVGANKNRAQFADWSNDVSRSALEETERFLRRLFTEGKTTQHELLTSRLAEVDSNMAQLYGLDDPGSGWTATELPTNERAGILTRAAFLALHARPTNGSPPLRGVAVLEKLLCAAPPEPPPDLDISVPEQDEEDPKTNRELFESRTQQPECLSCHLEIDGIGMSFEHYDSIGAFRTTDNGFDVDATGELINTDVDQPYDDALGLSVALAESTQVRYCMAVNWMRFTFARDEKPEEWCKVDAADAAAAENGGDLVAVLKTLLESAEFSHRTPIQ